MFLNIKHSVVYLTPPKTKRGCFCFRSSLFIL